MYITSDLFDGASAHHHGDVLVSTHWTTMSESPHTAGLGKRKRIDGEEGPHLYASCPHRQPDLETDLARSTCIHQQRSSPASRGTPRFHTQSPASFDSNHSLAYTAYSAATIYTTSERRPTKQTKRLGPKATLVKSTSHLMDIEPALPPGYSTVEARPNTTNDLRPCHVCKSAPKRRKDLENYLDCRRCDERTCYICARQCFGGCRKAVCKKCIVEVGEEGDPWCLGCYARNLNS